MSPALPFVSAAVLIVFSLAASIAAGEVNEDFVRMQEEMERLKGQIKERKESVQEISRREKTIFDELEKAGKSLAAAQAEEREIKSRLRRVEAEISRSTVYLSETKGVMMSKESTVSARLRAMYKHEKEGYFSSVFASDTQTTALRHYRYLTMVAASDHELLSDFNKVASDNQAVQKQLELQKAELIALQDEVERKSAQVAGRLKEKKDMLATIRKEKTFYESMVKGMEDSSLYIQNMLKQVSLASRSTSAISAPPAPAPSPANPPAAISARKDSGDKSDAKLPLFSEMRGRLPWPATGEVVGRFGRYQDPEKRVEAVRRGVEVAAPADSDIAAVFPGKVIYASWLKGYGKAVILDHGSTYYTVYAHISDILVKEGDRVEQGAIIGRVGDTGSLKGPDLYFEVRHGGDPEDPVLWLRRR